MRCALYARVSTLDQQPENQLAELRRYVTARGWDAAVEYVDPEEVRAAIEVPGGSVRAAARIWGVSKSTAARWISAGTVPDGASSGEETRA